MKMQTADKKREQNKDFIMNQIYEIEDKKGECLGGVIPTEGEESEIRGKKNVF
jgi:hypothetical protein